MRKAWSAVCRDCSGTYVTRSSKSVRCPGCRREHKRVRSLTYYYANAEKLRARNRAWHADKWNLHKRRGRTMKKPPKLYVIVYRHWDRETWEKVGWLVSEATTKDIALQNKDTLAAAGYYTLGPRLESAHKMIGFPETFSPDDPLPGAYDE